MTAAISLLIFVSLQRLSELFIAKRNTTKLRAIGAYEVGADHYPVMVVLHSAWIAALWFFGWDQPLNLLLLSCYAALQVLRVWILTTLGARWTTRILIVPNETLVVRGPYRFMRHPNYVLVAIEIPLLPLVFGLTWLAVVFAVLNFAMLAWRIKIEEQALRPT